MDALLPPLSALMVQMGSRHLSIHFTDAQKKLFGTPLFQTAVLFFMFYNGTKKPLLALLLTLCFFFVLFVILNEKHPHNMLPRWWLKKEGFCSDTARKSSDAVYESYVERLKDLYGGV